MIRQLDLEAGSELVQRVTAVYAFINRCLREGAYHHNREKVEDAIRILEIERQTWRQVCRKLVDERSRAIPARTVSAQRPARRSSISRRSPASRWKHSEAERGDCQPPRNRKRLARGCYHCLAQQCLTPKCPGEPAKAAKFKSSAASGR